ncbi:MAG: hypothetical protein BGN97_11185 [Microbacterium sp. 69-10]|nr:MAG: hypothetical protein BGN97_11185 [Microbacterium sp. 69-10]
MEALVRNAARRQRYAALAVESMAAGVVEAAHVIATSLEQGGKILVFGNGGSAACAQHFAAEFTGKLKMDRVPMAAISLTTDTSALTAIANDYGYDVVFARQVTALARPGDIVVGLSTSGASRNIILAFEAAKAVGAVTVGLTGAIDQLGGDHSLSVPLRETARVQEAHDLILHELAQVSERMVISDLAWDASACPFDFEIEADQIAGFRDWVTDTGEVLVTTNGVFDLFHEGHAVSLASARTHGDRLVVLVNDDASVKRLKGESRPIRNDRARMADLRRSSVADHVILMADDDPRRILELLRPDVHAKGRDYSGRGLVEAETVERHGGVVAYIDLVPGLSTTETVRRASAR